MLRVLHCVIDDKFIDSMIEVMDSLKELFLSEFFCVSDCCVDNYKYIKKKDRVRQLSAHEYLSFIENEKVDVIIIHGLGALHPSLILKIKPQIKVLWFAWGYDIYEPIYGHNPLILKNTLFHRYTRLVKKIVEFSNFRTLFGHHVYKSEDCPLERALSRIDYFSGVIPDEYNLIKNDVRNSFFKAEKVEYNYFSLGSHYSMSYIDEPFVEGCNVQIGNSGDITNNHIDIFHQLRKIDLSGNKIIVPISYSGERRYLSIVKWYGNYLWKDSFCPLEGFMPAEEYFQIIKSCRYVVFFHERQQAVGNIIFALWNGSMVFVSKSSPIFNYLVNCGFVFFTIQDDLKRIENKECLNMKDKMHNREMVIKHLSPEICLARIKKMIDLLSN